MAGDGLSTNYTNASVIKSLICDSIRLPRSFPPRQKKYPSVRMRPACPGGGFCRRPGNFHAPFRLRPVCLVSLDKNRIGWGGTSGIHPAILKNCAAQAALKSASEADFSLPIRYGFYQTRLRALYAAEKGHGSFLACGRSSLPDRRPLRNSLFILCGKAQF